MESLSSVSDIVTMHDCLNPAYDEDIEPQSHPTRFSEKRQRTNWSAVDTQRFLDHMEIMNNIDLGEMFGRSVSQIANKRRVESRKSKRRLALA